MNNNAKPVFGDIRFISDTEPAEDALQTHRRTAAFLAETIRTNETIRSIALVGPWGSGKSLVVRFLAEALGSTETGDVSSSRRMHDHIPAAPNKVSDGAGASQPAAPSKDANGACAPGDAPEAIGTEASTASSSSGLLHTSPPGDVGHAPTEALQDPANSAAAPTTLHPRKSRIRQKATQTLQKLKGSFGRDASAGDPEKPSTLLLVYDAWLHQSDSPRRSFVEVLLATLVPEGGHLLAQWKEALDRVTGRLEVTDITDSPVASLPIFLLLLAMCIGPFGITALLRPEQLAGFLDTSFKDTVFWTFLPTTIPAITRAAIVLILIAPTIAIVLYMAAWIVFWIRLARARLGIVANDRPVDISMSGVNAAVLNRKPERSKKRIIKDPSPTTLEFQTLFQDITRALKNGQPFAATKGRAHAQRKIDRVVVVIDNLDRLTSEDAREIWPVMRSICLGSGVASSGPSTPNGLPDITLLAPLDTIVFSRSPEEGEADEARAMAHMEKSFDLIVRMPRPRLSSWQTYFAGRLRFVLKNKTDESTLQKVIGLADLYLKPRQDKVTPRELNNLANRIAIASMQWGSTIDLPTISGFVFDEPSIGDDLKTFFRKEAPIADVNRNWRVAYFAMYHGIKPDESLFVIDEEAVERCLARNDFQRWEELSLHDEFATILLRTVVSWRTSIPLSFNALLNAAVHMANSSDADRFVGVWSQIPSAVENAPFQSPMSAADATKLITLLENSESDPIQAVTRFLSNALERSVGPQGNVEPGKRAAIALLENADGVLASKDPVSSAIVLKGQHEPLLEVLGRIDGSHRTVEFLEYFKPYDIEKALIDSLSAKQQSGELSQTFRVLLASRTNIDWPNVLVKMISQVASGGTTENVAWALRAFAGVDEPGALMLSRFFSHNAQNLAKQAISGTLPATVFATIAVCLCVPWKDADSFGAIVAPWSAAQAAGGLWLARYARALYGDDGAVDLLLDRSGGEVWLAPLATEALVEIINDTEDLQAVATVVMDRVPELPAPLSTALRDTIAVALAARGGPPPGWTS